MSNITIEKSGDATGAYEKAHDFGPITRNFNSTSKFDFYFVNEAICRAECFNSANTVKVIMRSINYPVNHPK